MRAALERGSRIVVVTTPAPEQLSCWELLGPGTVIVCADQTAALDWVAAAPAGRSVHAVTALSRAGRLLKSGTVDLLAGSLTDLSALVGSSQLKLDTVALLVLAWPEGLAASDQALLDSFLSEAGKTQRVILTWNPAALTGLLERQAPRAPQFGQPAFDADGRPAAPVGPARYLVATPDRRMTALRQALDTLDPTTVAVWTPDERHAARLRDLLGLGSDAVVTTAPPRPVSLVICARVPTREQLTALLPAGPVVVVTAPYQLPYLRTLASPCVPLGQATAAQAARERGAQLRERIAARLARADVDAELEQLAPLFDRYDPAEVAAALVALRRDEPSPSAEASPAQVAGPSWVKLWVSVGKKDRAAAKDLVGALTRELGVLREHIGRVEVKDAFSLVEIAGPAADSVMKGLSRVSVRGKRLTARLDRAR